MQGSDNMTITGTDADEKAAIEAVIQRQFESMSWNAETPPNLDAFRSDYLPDALLFPSSRPVVSQTVSTFIDRMRGMSQSTLLAFDERVIETNIQVAGNVAVAAVLCEQLENKCERNETAEMLLLVKSGGQWRIAAQAWDKISTNPA
jgi:hypothetical protein